MMTMAQIHNALISGFLHSARETGCMLKAIKEDDLKAVLDLYMDEGINIDDALKLTVITASNHKYYATIVNFLLKKGANPNVLTYCTNLEIAKILFNHGADINKVATGSKAATDFTGNYFLYTALTAALWHKDPSLVKFALENGANINVKNERAQTPLKYMDFEIKNFVYEKLGKIKSEIQLLFIPYLLNNNQKDEFFYVLENHPSLDQVEFTKINNAACKNCISWVNELLEADNPPKWLTAAYKNVLSNFLDQLVNKLYPDLLKNINIITDEKNFPLIKQALLVKESVFGLARTLDYVMELYTSGILDDAVAFKIRDLHDKMDFYFDLYQKFNLQSPTLSEKEIKEIHALIEPLHQSLMSLGGDYQKTCHAWQTWQSRVRRQHSLERRQMLKRFSDIEGFPTRDKIEKINQASDWLTLSLSAAKDVKGNPKALVFHAGNENRNVSRRSYE